MTTETDDDELPKVVAAAVMGPGDVPVSLPQPARHHDVITHMVMELGHPAPVIGRQGFMLSDGTFANRRQARMFAEANGQLLARAHDGDLLFSEDVW